MRFFHSYLHKNSKYTQFVCVLRRMSPFLYFFVYFSAYFIFAPAKTGQRASFLQMRIRKECVYFPLLIVVTIEQKSPYPNNYVKIYLKNIRYSLRLRFGTHNSTFVGFTLAAIMTKNGSRSLFAFLSFFYYYDKKEKNKKPRSVRLLIPSAYANKGRASGALLTQRLEDSLLGLQLIFLLMGYSDQTLCRTFSCLPWYIFLSSFQRLKFV